MRLALTILALFLAGCTSSGLPLSKSAPVPVVDDALVRPPWEAYVKAGPGAENDLDLETLNGPQAATAQPPQAITAQTAEVAPAEEPEKPKAAPKPGDVQIKAVAVLPVRGGNAKGNAELTAAMRKILTEAGWEVLPKSRKDALSIQGRVAVDPPLAGKQMVHLQWLVSTPTAKNLGDVKQDNAVPDGSLNAGWGENAGFAAQGAAEGIFKLIEKFR